MARRGASRSGFPSKVRRSTKLPRAGSNPASDQSGSASATTQLFKRAAERFAPASALSGLAVARTIPVPCLPEPIANRVRGLEAEAFDLREVVSAIRLAVRLRGIPFDSVAQSGNFGKCVDDIADATDLAAAHVDPALDAVHDSKRDPGGVLDIDEVALSGTVAPDRNCAAALLRVVKFLDQRRNGVPSLGIEPVARAKEIGRYDVRRFQTVAVLIGLEHGEHCELGACVTRLRSVGAAHEDHVF